MITRLLTSRPYINLITLIALGVSIFFIYSNSQKIQEVRQRAQLFESRSVLPAMIELPSPIDYKPNAYQDILFRKVLLHGHFLVDHEIYIENRVSENSPRPNSKKTPGFHVMMPFLLNTGQIIWVNRGWLRRDPTNRQNILDASSPVTTKSIEGYITPGHKDFLTIAPTSPHRIGGHVVALNFYMHDDPKELPNRNVYPFLITQTSDNLDGLIRPEIDYYYMPDYSFDLKTWWLIFIFIIGHWILSGVMHTKNQIASHKHRQ